MKKVTLEFERQIREKLAFVNARVVVMQTKKERLTNSRNSGDQTVQTDIKRLEQQIKAGKIILGRLQNSIFNILQKDIDDASAFLSRTASLASDKT